ncbi:sugar phosphate isomerase/epimerase [Sphingobacterium daejeonense]|uniref:sugar phosphate isomerase/epimerase family protein n=1 Tax=Sphingobacterium daejeonense TaxID=371142 RepID=UPI0021A84698|nr:sugar phosphate isomerase/epimerase family protein [Sphingobacterium daejeonense]MCT1530484.1 sugar phosphate isomerase/epimerase [Sphingobacterium daejeonense]
MIIKKRKFYTFFLSFIFISTFTFSCSNIKKETPSNIKIGVALYSFNKFSFVDAVEKAKSANVNLVEGFSFHELGGQFGTKKLLDLSDEEIGQLKKTLDSTKMTMPSIYADAKTLEEWKHIFDQAKKIGLKFMVGEPDPQFLDDINKMAGQYQMKFAIHEHAKGLSKYWHPDSALAAIKDRENLKICADIGHWVRSGLDPVECLKKVQGNVISVHVKDLDSFGNLNATDVNISTGIIDYPKIFEELKRQQFDGYVFIECEHDWEDNLKDVKESVNYITQVSK